MQRLTLSALILLTACGPMSVAEAERQCFERARLAQKPRGEVSVGINSDGRASGSVGVTVSADYLRGRDPAAVYETCVVSKSGELPTQPLYARPDWRG